jgi:hypothetical protein
MNHFKLLGCVSVMTLLAGVVVVALSGCASESAPPATTSNVGGIVKVEKSKCETQGPIKLTPDAEGHFVLKHIPPRRNQFCAILVPVDGNSFDLFSAGFRASDYRRNHPADLISHVAFFNNSTLEIAAIAEVGETIAGTPQDIARATWLRGGLDLEGILHYFAGRDYGFAIQLRNFQKLSTPISLTDARHLDSKFQRPYTYLFLDRHPVIEGEVLRRRTEPIDLGPKDLTSPAPRTVDGWPEP